MNNNDRVIKIALACSVFLLAVSAIFAVSAVSKVRMESENLKARTAVLDRLLDMRAEASAWRKARKAFTSLAEKEPSPLQGIIKRTLTGTAVSDIRDVPMESVPGWTFHQKEVTFGEIAVCDLVRVVRNAETAENRPPWRLVKCSLRSIPGKDGTVRAVLLFQAIERE